MRAKQLISTQNQIWRSTGNKVASNQIRKRDFQILKTIKGIGDILGMTIMLETGDIRHFASVGNYASYCRCVKSIRMSNGKKKGRGNAKADNKYLSWAFSEAAHFAIRFEPATKRFYEHKK